MIQAFTATGLPLIFDNVLNWLQLYHTPGMWQAEGSSPDHNAGLCVSSVSHNCGLQSLSEDSEGLRLKPSTICPSPDADKDCTLTWLQLLTAQHLICFVFVL